MLEFSAYLTERILLPPCIKLRKSTMPSDTKSGIVWILWFGRRRGSWESKQSGYPKGAPVWRTQKFTARREPDSKNSNAAPRDALAGGGSSQKLDLTRFVVTSNLMNEYKVEKSGARETQATKMETSSYRRGRRMGGLRGRRIN